MQLYDTIIEELKKKFLDHTNFIINYFNENKPEYFEDLSFDYSKIPQNTRAISILDRYNGTIKEYLGEEEHECNCLTFMTFIKNEIKYIIDKLSTNINKNILYHSKYTKFTNDKYDNSDLKNDVNIFPPII